MKIQTASPLPRLLPAPKPAAAAEASAPDRVELSQGGAPQGPQLVPVTHTRELRGAWIATVWNINFPKNPGTDPEAQKAELRGILDRLKENGFNSVFFQVRPEGDALYSSALEPWSNSLTGTQGVNPGYDPLATLVDECHKRGLEAHAWFNPFRASAASKQQVSPHMAADHPEVIRQYGSNKWMDPGAQIVRQRVVDVCRDVTHRYNVDGIHFDDYFYPYPNGNPFPDDATWNAYKAGGGTLSREDWRRDNVNQTVQGVHDAVKGEKPYVRFGISPFGLPAPDRPADVTGFNQYEEMYADPQKWMNEGTVDYLAPQLYWTTKKKGQPYGSLINWWADHTVGGRHIFAGNDLDALGSNSSWTVDEFRKQVRLTRAKADAGAKGNIYYNVGAIMENRQNINSLFRDELYTQPALTPALASAHSAASAPDVKSEGRTLSLTHKDSVPLRAWTVYRPDGQGWKLDRIVPGTESQIELPAGRWAVAAATMEGVESQGVVVDLA